MTDDLANSFQKLREDYKKEVVYLIDPELALVLHGGINEKGENELILPSENNVYSETRYFKPQNSNLLHFTSLRSLYSIISEKSIRAYDLNNSNDPRELTYATESFNIFNKEDLRKFKKRTLVLSFCDPDSIDNLTMWRLYGQDGRGVAIIFSVHNDPNGWNGYHLGNVQYNPLVEFQKAHLRFIEKNPNFMVDLSKLLAFHKAPYFKIENETRLIYNKHRANYEPKLFCRDINKFNQSVNYLKIDLFKEMKSEKIKNPINDRPVLKIEKIVVGFQLANQIKMVKKELEKVIGIVLGYPVDVELSALGEIFSNN